MWSPLKWSIIAIVIDIEMIGHFFDFVAIDVFGVIIRKEFEGTRMSFIVHVWNFGCDYDYNAFEEIDKIKKNGWLLMDVFDMNGIMIELIW